MIYLELMNYSFFDIIPIGLIVVDSNQMVVYANPMFCNLVELSERRVVNKKIQDVLIFSPKALHQIVENLAKDTSTAFVETELNAPNQAAKKVQIATAPISTNEILVVIHDVSLEESLQKKYKQELSQKEDYIAKLNRQLFEVEFMLSLLSSGSTEEEPFAFLDKCFKKILTTLGSDFILLLTRNDNSNVETTELSGFYTRDEHSISAYRGLIGQALHDWKSIDPKTFGADSHVNISDDGNYKIVSVVLPCQQQQWKIFLYHFAHNQAQQAEMNKNFLEVLSKQIDLLVENKNLFHQSVTDEKTQIYNSRFFTYRFSNELGRAKRYKRPLSLLVIDIDHFKKFNDTHGHLVGDFVLKQVAKTLKNVFRSCDLVARFGGEEFVVLCPETNKEAAQLAAERARSTIENLVLEVEKGKNLKVTVSMGVASFPVDADNTESLIQCADQAVYAAKKAGRNRVEVFKSE